MLFFEKFQLAFKELDTFRIFIDFMVKIGEVSAKLSTAEIWLILKLFWGLAEWLR